MSKLFKIAAIETGLNPHNVSCHSLRSGGVELTLQSLSFTEGGGQVRFIDIHTIHKKLEHHSQQ
ncbi:hypothetical protein PHMEG_00016615 [Phytophthora megakarya]|uniref:Uncharacterized protein n=1 Tax=Phytophthora megakarya TaxID=4795 RepID=A0A225W0Z2_9STRA|nr:hypothetical protein PHMEG_00016615 [Phytophthora megakarya]